MIAITFPQTRVENKTSNHNHIVNTPLDAVTLQKLDRDGHFNTSKRQRLCNCRTSKRKNTQ
jgi:hypothetical protein